MLYVERSALFAKLELRVPGLQIQNAGGIWPFEAEGELRGLKFYLRDRGTATLNVGNDELWAPLYQAVDAYGDAKPAINLDNFAERFCELVPMLRRAPRLWEFASKADPKRPHAAWGFTPEEAWERLHEPNAYALERGFDSAAQLRAIRAEGLDPNTITVDDRVWPDPEPDFTVLPG